MLLARGWQKKLDCGGQISPTCTYTKDVIVEKVLFAPVNAASLCTLLAWLRSGVVAKWRRFHPRLSLSLTKSHSDMVKLAWQPLSLVSDQSAGLFFRLPAASTHRAVPGAQADGGCCHVMGYQHCQWGNSLQLRHVGEVWPLLWSLLSTAVLTFLRREELTAQIVHMVL